MLTLVTREENVVVEVKVVKTAERAERRKATAKAEKDYKAAKAEHIHKAALMGSRRYNGLYKPYKRESFANAIEEYLDEAVTLDEVVLAIAKAECYSRAAEEAAILFPRYWGKYPAEEHLIQSITRPDVEMAMDEANTLGAEWEAANGPLPIINAEEYFGKQRLANMLAENRPEWINDLIKYEIIDSWY